MSSQPITRMTLRANGEKLKKWRKLKTKKSQEKFADDYKLSLSTYRRAEQGENIDIEILTAIAAIYKKKLIDVIIVDHDDLTKLPEEVCVPSHTHNPTPPISDICRVILELEFTKEEIEEVGDRQLAMRGLMIAKATGAIQDGVYKMETRKGSLQIIIDITRADAARLTNAFLSKQLDAMRIVTIQIGEALSYAQSSPLSPTAQKAASDHENVPLPITQKTEPVGLRLDPSIPLDEPTVKQRLRYLLEKLLSQPFVLSRGDDEFLYVVKLNNMQLNQLRELLPKLSNELERVTKVDDTDTFRRAILRKAQLIAKSHLAPVERINLDSTQGFIDEIQKLRDELLIVANSLVEISVPWSSEPIAIRTLLTNV